MTWQTELQHIVFSKLFKKRILQGAAIACVLVCIFLSILFALSGGGSIKPWILVPIVYVSVGGAFGGAFYSLMDVVRNQGAWQKVLANVVSVLAYMVGLYMFLILGLSVIGLWD